MLLGDQQHGCANNGFVKLFRDAVLFVLRTQHAVDRIGSAVAGFVVVADLHLAEQPDGQQVQSAKQQAQATIINGPCEAMTGTWRRNFSTPSQATIPLPPNRLSRPKVPKKCSGRER